MTENNEMMKFMVREIAMLSSQVGALQAEQVELDHRISNYKEQTMRLMEDKVKLEHQVGAIRKDFERVLEGKASRITCIRLIKNIMGFGLKDSLDEVKSGRFSEALRDVAYAITDKGE
jgi:hypothetical protein